MTDKAPAEGQLRPISLAEGPLVTHHCSCQCGALRYDVRAPSLQDPPTQSVNACNCSICLKSGYLTIYPPRTNVEWIHGFPEMIKNYRCSTKTIDHMQCKECGSSLGIDFGGKIFEGDRLGINVRMVHNIDVGKLVITRNNGRNMFPENNRDW